MWKQVLVLAAVISVAAADPQIAWGQPESGRTAGAAQGVLEGVSIELTNVPGVNHEHMEAVTAAEIQLESIRVMLTEGARISELLQEHGIVPNGAAYGLMFSLNDQLENLNLIRAGEELVVPSPVWATQFPATEYASHLVAIQQGQEQRDALRAQLTILDNLSRGANIRPVIAQTLQIEEILRDSRQLLSGDLAVSEESYAQVADQIEYLSTVMRNAEGSGREPTAEEMENIRDVRADIGEKRATVSAGGRDTVLVTVKTFDEDGNEVPGYGVRYVGKALFCRLRDNPRQFLQNSSPTSQQVPVGRQRFWAVSASEDIVSNVRAIQIRRSLEENNVIDITVGDEATSGNPNCAPPGD